MRGEGGRGEGGEVSASEDGEVGVSGDVRVGGEMGNAPHHILNHPLMMPSMYIHVHVLTTAITCSIRINFSLMLKVLGSLIWAAKVRFSLTVSSS